MRKLSIIITALTFILGCVNADEPLSVKTMNLKIKIVNEKNNIFRVQTVKWWNSESQKIKHRLECETDLCAEWEIKEHVSGSIVIRANTSIVQENDPYCWDLYGGEVIIMMPIQKVTIVMKYQNTVCS
jgi:hypothetical protein